MADTRKGPFCHRLLVFVFCAVFGVLFYWLLGFIINDLGTWPGPDYTTIEEGMLDAVLVETAESLNEQSEENERAARELKERQQLLKDSIDNSQRTMDQLLEIQRLSLEKGSELSPDEQTAMAENIRLFLENQKQYQTLNEEISQLSQEAAAIRQQERDNDELLNAAREPILAEYRRQQERHNLRMAGLKLAVLVPLLLVAVVLYLKKRTSIYAPLIYSFAIAVAAKVMLVIHEHFPARYFKYILTVVALAIVTCVLVVLLRMIAFPKRDWLLKQYREAYEAFLCPICSYPIRRGPLKYRSWTRRSIRKAAFRVPSASSTEQDAPYTCPMCATKLFEACGSCQAIRHSLLPACHQCGDATVQEANG